MIKIELHSLKSRIARRLFLLFLTVILIPSAATGIISYDQLATLLKQTSHQDLEQASKEYGLNLFNRLVISQDYLRIILSDLTFSTPINDTEWAIFKSRFRGVHIYKNNEYSRSLFDSFASQDVWAQYVKEPTQKLLVRTKSPTEKSVYLIESTYYGHDHFVAIAELNAELLWPNSELDAYEEICISTKTGVVITCDNQLDQSALSQLTSTKPNHFVSWQDDKHQSMVSSSWGLFLDYQFGVDEWVIITSKPESILLEQLTHFKQSYLPGLLLAIMLIIFVTLVMIRRHLVPVEALIKGTKAIERNELDHRVDIQSHDEYEELAASFNAMADKINSEARINNTISSLDQQLLFQAKLEDVVHQIMKGLEDLAYCSVAYAYIFDTHLQHEDIYYDWDSDTKRYQARPCHLASIRGKTEHIQDGVPLHLSHQALVPLIERDDIRADLSYSIYSLHHEGELIGILITGHTLTIPHIRFAEYMYHVSVVISALQRDKMLEVQANYDKLTGLHNRSYFQRHVESAIAKVDSTVETAAILFIDLDRFKIINDTLGHNVGDLLLIEAAARIKRLLPNNACAARFGGDEFTLFIANADKATLNTLAMDLIDALSANYALNDYSASVSASIGISLFPNDADQFNSLLKCSDMAMYEAKNKGRECYEFFSEKLIAAIERRKYLEDFLKTAVPCGYMEIYYQPKIDIQNRCLSGFEALSRFKHPTEGFLSPFELFNLAEDTGSIHYLGEYVLRTAMHQVKRWQTAGIWQGRMAINVSPLQLFEPDFFERLFQLIQEINIEPTLIELEITEGIFIDNPEKAKVLLKQIRALGITIAIDDFGTGYSSLSYITQLPIDNLKIDRSFITQIEQGEKYQGVLSSMIQMANHLGLKVTAEGIERQDHLQFLLEHNCHDIQGYLYSKPLNASDSEALLLQPQLERLFLQND